MAALTVTQTGPLSLASTFGGTAFTNGDTITCGTFTLTIDQNCAIGNSPNDSTTKVLDKTSATGKIIIAVGVTVTMKGNIGGVNGSTFRMEGGTLIFDNSASGGSPVYTLINVGFQIIEFIGTSANHNIIQAISGQTCGINVPVSAWTCNYTDFTRVASFMAANSISGNLVHSNCTHASCGRLAPVSTGTTNSCTITSNTFLSGTHATDDINLSWSGTYSSGTRLVNLNVLSKAITYGSSKSFTIRDNYFGAGVLPTASTGAWNLFYSNFVKHDATPNGGNGMLLSGYTARNYFVVSNGVGNPHFVAPQAYGSDVVFEQNIFESDCPDLVDYGDAYLLNLSMTSGGAYCVIKNSLVLRSGYSGNNASSGTLITIYNNSASLAKLVRNTVNVDNPTSGSFAKRSAVATAESSTGGAGQIGAMLSNLMWGSSAGQGYKAERLTGNVKDIITAANANNNALFNGTAGNNQRGYDDQAASNTMWTAGDAVAAGVDSTSLSTDPSFYAGTRGLASWCAARGHGAATMAAGYAAIAADPTRAKDLIAYVFEGFRPTTSAYRLGAADGGCVGASNYNDTTRNYSKVNSQSLAIEYTYGIQV